MEVPGRLHVSLIDMSTAGYRRHGGVGFAIAGGYKCRGALASKTLVVDQRRETIANLSQRLLIELKLEEIRSKHSLTAIEFIICGGFDAHGGFGSGTALTLAAIEALYVLNEVQYTENEIIIESGRGGVSGLGVRTYFSGGLWVDVGVPNKGSRVFTSSDQMSRVDRHSTGLLRLPMPDWAVGICIPLTNMSTPREVEEQFFANFTGAPGGMVEDLVYQIFMGLLPAVLESDHETFAVALDRIQKTYWKAAERYLHSSVIDVESHLRTCGIAGIGMSSLGPAVFFLDPSLENVRSIFRDQHISADTFIARTANEGRKFSYA